MSYEHQDRYRSRRAFFDDYEELVKSNGRRLRPRDQMTPAVSTNSAPASTMLPGNFSTELLRSLPAAVYTTDAAGRLTFYNDAAAELWGYRPELGKSAYCGSLKLYWPDGTPLPHDECPMALALKEERPNRGMQAVAERPDGSRARFMAFPTPFFDERGELAGAVNMLVDVTQDDAPGAPSSESDGYFRVLFDLAPIAVISCDRHGRIDHCNQLAMELLGRSSEPGDEVDRSPLRLRMPDGSLLLSGQGPIADVLRTGVAARDVDLVIERPDGSRLPVLMNISALKSERGEINGTISTLMDNTEGKWADEQNHLLFREMTHRVANSFAVTSGVVSLSAHSAQSPEDMAESIRERLDALRRANDLYRPTLVGSRVGTDEKTTLHAIIRTILSPYLDPQRADHGKRVVITGPDIHTGPRAVNGLALVLHELTTNALKYGALSSPTGTIRIEGSLRDGEMQLSWIERGGPTIQGKPGDEGFGAMLTRRIVTRQFGGSLAYAWEPDGLAVHLAVSVDRLAT